jgi:hypothetical protein
MEGPGAESEEKREPVSDIDTEVVGSLKVLDPRRPIREADIDGLDIPQCSAWAIVALKMSLIHSPPNCQAKATQPI